ncbi:MAG: hypothetical protein IKD46_02875 [Lentisphaeria bacterium]|nr:hypothetical protein [Lentisphaeria bacterium]
MMWKHCSLPVIFAVAATCFAGPNDGAAPSIVYPGEIVVKTPESIAQGKQNVRNVAEQLRSLFRPLQKPRKTVSSEGKPYLKIINAPNDRSILIYRCRYSTAAKILASVEALITDQGYVESAEEQNLLIINDTKSNIQALAEALPTLDMPSPQVLIEAKVIEVMVSDGMQRNLSFGVSNVQNNVPMLDPVSGSETVGSVANVAGFSTSQLSPSQSNDGGKLDWTFSSGDTAFNVAFQWLLNASDAKVLSSPIIVVARNEESTISNGQDVPIQSQTITSGSISTSTTFKRVGVTLKVEPKMINHDSVTLLVEPEVSNIQSYQTISQGSGNYQVPLISIRNISTNVKLGNGQVLMMGGLYNSRESVSQERIPFLSDMPYFGEFFTSKYRAKELLQLLFFIRVQILTPDEVADGILFDPDTVAEVNNKIGEILRKSPSLPAPKSTLHQVKEEFVDRTLNSPTLPADPEEEKKPAARKGSK